MHIVIITDNILKEELLNGFKPDAEITCIANTEQLNKVKNVDAYIDLLFEFNDNRISVLSELLPKLVLINSVAWCLKETNKNFVRINGWPGFLKSEIIEASAAEENRPKAEELFKVLNKKPVWLPDKIGFVSARVISMIINEASLLLKEGVSSEEEINTAMKKGTNYPLGPFEWLNKIGSSNIKELLQRISRER